MRGKSVLLLAIALTLAGACPAAARPRPARELVAHLGELPGFRDGSFSLHPAATPRAYIRVALEDTPAEAGADLRRLTSDGFRQGVRESFANQSAGGVSVAAVYRSARGADAELALALANERSVSGDVGLVTFAAPGIPGAQGFTASNPQYTSRYADVLFAVGRCFFIVGDGWEGVTSEQEVTAAPIAGATAVYRRNRRYCTGATGRGRRASLRR